jgi:hypothetical protein
MGLGQTHEREASNYGPLGLALIEWSMGKWVAKRPKGMGCMCVGVGCDLLARRFLLFNLRVAAVPDPPTLVAEGFALLGF